MGIVLGHAVFPGWALPATSPSRFPDLEGKMLEGLTCRGLVEHHPGAC